MISSETTQTPSQKTLNRLYRSKMSVCDIFVTHDKERGKSQSKQTPEQTMKD